MIEINSLSSGMMLGITLYRNRPGVANKCIAGAGYALTAAVAAVESVVALIFSAFSLAIHPLSTHPLEFSIKWLKSSLFSVGWSMTDFVLNPFALVLVANEDSARRLLQGGNLMQVPPGAVL